MGLQIWLPLRDNLENKGLANITVAQVNTTIDTNGKIGSCYSFNGTNSGLTIYNAPQISNWTESTVCFWIKDAPTGKTQCIINHRSVAGKGLAVFLINNKIRVDTDNSQTNFSDTYNFSEWTHIAIVSKGTERKIYMNGDLLETKTANEVNYTSSGSYASIGASSVNTTVFTNNWLQGLLNDFRLYDEALSPMQIKIISQGLVAHYLLNNNGNGNNNLIPNQGEYTINNPFVWSSNKIDGSKWIPNSAFEVKPSTTYTFSLCCDGNLQTQHLPKPEPSPEEKAFTVYLYLSNDGTTKSWQTGQYDTATNLNSNNFSHKQIGQKHIWTFTTSSTQRYVSIRVNNYSNGTDTLTLNYWNFKLEEGDKATSWCPNSTDSIYTQLGYDNNIEYDVSGYCNNGTKYNITDYTSDTPRYSVATKFNNTDGYINIGRGGMVKDAITVNVWAYTDDWSALTSTDKIISCTEGGGWNFEIESSQKIKFIVGTGTTSNAYYSATGRVVAEIPEGWHMFTGTYDGFTVKFYIDGTLEKSNTALTTKTPLYYHRVNSILIGAEATNTATGVAGSYFNGNLSDTRIYATALSESDIQSLYNNSAFVDSSGNVYATEYIES